MPAVFRLFRLSLLLLILATTLSGMGLYMALDAPAAHAQNTAAITIGTTDLPSTLDPGEAYDFSAWEVLSHLYTGLTRQIPGTFEYELALAEDVQISADRLTYTFTLRADAAFSDGTPITAQTFVDSINRVLALRRDATLAVEPYVASVTATEAGELVFTLMRPVPYFLGLVSLPPYFPQHPGLANKGQPQPFPTDLIGNGPYALENFTIRNQIVLVANSAYQYGPAPATPTITLRRYERSQDLREALQNHEVDIAWRALFTGHLIQLETAAPDGLQFVEVPSTRVFYMYFNRDREPFDDPSAREAITMLVEREELAREVAFGHMSSLNSLVPPEYTDAYAPIWPNESNLEQAELVLHAGGYRTRGQLQLQFGISYSQQTYGLSHTTTFLQLIRRYFNVSDYVNAGLFTDIETPTVISSLERGELNDNSMIFAWTPIVPHPAAYLRPLAHTAEPIPSSGLYATPQIARLLDEAALLADPAEQGIRYREIADRLLFDNALIPLFQDHVYLVAWDNIQGIRVESNYFLHYDQLTKN